MAKPKIDSYGQRELEKADQQFQKFDENVKKIGEVIANEQANPVESIPQVQLSQKDLEAAGDVYLKPKRQIMCREKFNENFRSQYDFDREYVRFLAENLEIINERIEIWTRPYPGIPAEFWEVPVNKPVWGPRYLAEQIRRKSYHRLVMEDRPTGSEGGMQFFGAMAVDTIKHRLNAHPLPKNSSLNKKVSNF